MIILNCFKNVFFEELFYFIWFFEGVLKLVEMLDIKVDEIWVVVDVE